MTQSSVSDLSLSAEKTDAPVMWLACLLVFMAQMATTVYLPSLPVIMRDLQITQSTAELSISAFVIAAALPIPLWGIAAERWGRRAPLLILLLTFMLSSLLLACCSGAAALLLLRTLQGAAAGGCAIIARIVVKDHWSGDELARRLSVLSIAFISALGGGQFIGGLIGQYSRWPAGFALMAVVAALALLLAMRIPMQAGRHAASDGNTLGNYFGIFRHPGFFWPACAGGLGFATTVTLQEVSPFVFQEHFHLAIADFGYLGLLIGLSYFSGAMLVNRLVGRVGGKRLMQAGAGLIAAATLLIGVMWQLTMLQDALYVFIALYCLTIFGQALLFPNSMARAVSSVAGGGAQAVALCGFLQQGIAGLVATASVLFHHGGSWTLVLFGLGATTYAVVQTKMQSR
jgi:DHA1 family bicyclomycin/chloramphenicol resistance-like MFS transporter